MKFSNMIEINLVGFIAWYTACLLTLSQGRYELSFFDFLGTTGYLITVCNQLNDLKRG